MHVTYNKNIRPDHKHKISQYLTKWEWMIPSWVQNVHCNLWDAEVDGERIAIKVNYDYRAICLDFSSGWLQEEDAAQESQVVHEIVHMYTAILADFARDRINTLCPTSEAEKFNAVLQEELRIRHESVTCDLTDVIWRKLSNN
jgi:hypothetical protein